MFGFLIGLLLGVVLVPAINWLMDGFDADMEDAE